MLNQLHNRRPERRPGCILDRLGVNLAVPMTVDTSAKMEILLRLRPY